MKAIHLFTFTLAITTSFAANAKNSGNEMLSQCRSAIALIENKRKLSAGEAYDSGWCIGFIDGLVRQNAYIGDYVPKKNRFCVDPNVSYSQSAMVLVRYLETNPQSLHLPNIVLATAAFADAFPCGQTEQ